MNTRESIVHLADRLIRQKGYNAFSFYDISKSIGIKTASIHYHFPTKCDLGVAVVREQIHALEQLKKRTSGKDPLQQLKAFLSVYEKIRSDGAVCLVGSLATDLNTMDEKVKAELQRFADMFLDWLTEILRNGKAQHVFSFPVPPRTKAVMIITNMLAIVQLSRLTGEADFKLVKKEVVRDLAAKKHSSKTKNRRS